MNARILVVDDTAFNLKILYDLLSKENYEVLVAQSGKKALDILAATMPDLVLLDIMMPEMDGFAVLKTMKGAPEWQDIPVIFVTAKTDHNSLVEGFQLGAVDYITKPFQSDELLARIHTHVALRKAHQELQEQHDKLELAYDEIKTLQGLLPICFNCKKVRDDKGYWIKLEEYMATTMHVKLSHGLCDDCLKKLYPQEAQRIIEAREPI
jgi:DNA-binding response OmpR family regulator